jgi:hypothetical protein
MVLFRWKKYWQLVGIRGDEMNGVQEARKALALSTKRGVPLIFAGLLFWFVAGISGLVLPESMVVWVYIFGIGVVFPIGVLISMLFKIDIFAKGNPLGVLAGIVGRMQVFFAPIIIMLFFKDPRWIPFTLGVLNGAHFLPYTWIYNSKTYLFDSITTTIVATGIGAIFINTTIKFTPFTIAAVFLVSILGLLSESKFDLRNSKYVSTNL